MSESPLPGQGEWRRGRMGAEFHPDPNKTTDPVETLIDRLGPEAALAEIEANLDQNPDDAEARRQATLVVKLLEDRLKNIKDKLQH